MLGKRLRLVLWAYIGCAQFACGPDADPPEQASELEVFDTRLIGEPAPEEPEEIVEVALLDPGSEPRRVLRYRLEPDVEQRVVIKSSWNMSYELDGNPLSKQRTPPTRLEVMLRAQPGDDETGRRLQIDFIEAEAVDYDRIMFARGDDLVMTVDSLLEEQIDTQISDRGILARAFYEEDLLAIGATEAAGRASLMGVLAGVLQTALPEEKVGVGARWRVQTPDSVLPFDGAETNQVFELVAMDGDRIELAEAGTFDVDEGSLFAPNMDIASSDSGRRILDLGRIAPTRYEGTTTMSMSWEMRDGQEVRRMHLTMVMEFEGVGS